MSLLYRVQDLQFKYKLGEQDVTALSDVSFALKTGCFVCISGPSGSGKTTLLNVLGLIEEPQEGRVEFLDRDFKKLSESEKSEIRKYQVGFVFQSFHLFPVLSAEENIDYFLSRQGLPKAERRQRTETALQTVGLWEHRQKRPLNMSGGQRQRVAIARALAKNPRVIIADEPTASLDQKTGENIMHLLIELNRNKNISFLISSHDPMVQKTCKEHLRLRDGVLV